MLGAGINPSNVTWKVLHQGDVFENFIYLILYYVRLLVMYKRSKCCQKFATKTWTISTCTLSLKVAICRVLCNVPSLHINNFERVVAFRAYTTRIVSLNDKYSVARRVGSDLHTYLLTNYLKYHLDGFEQKIKICSQPSLLATLYEKTRGDNEKSLTALYYGLIS